VSVPEGKISLALAWKYIGGKQQFFQSCCIFGGQAGVKASDNVIYIRQLLKLSFIDSVQRFKKLNLQ